MGRAERMIDELPEACRIVRQLLLCGVEKQLDDVELTVLSGEAERVRPSLRLNVRAQSQKRACGRDGGEWPVDEFVSLDAIAGIEECSHDRLTLLLIHDHTLALRDLDDREAATRIIRTRGGDFVRDHDAYRVQTAGADREGERQWRILNGQIRLVGLLRGRRHEGECTEEQQQQR